jgi:anti-anti-sigma factor
MKQEIDYDAQARTNPVFLTAKTAICLMADAGIPGADQIVSELKINSGGFGMTDPEMMLGNELVVEAKYRTMCRRIEETGIPINIDLPCGYTPKAIHLTDKGLRFIGLDLPIVAQEVEPILLSLAAHPDRIQIHGVDATNPESLVNALRGIGGPVCISTEGMMMYFTESEASSVISNIRSLLEKYGGCWITPDPEYMVQFFLTFQSVLGESAIQKLVASRDIATGQSDVINLTNSLIINPADIKGSSETASAFLQKHGLKVERINLSANMPELAAYRKLTTEQITSFKEAMAKCYYWKITPDADQKRQFKEQKTQPFEMKYAVMDDQFKVSLCGRMDTITAPELLTAWEAEKARHKICGIEIDCSYLQYASSAGLRILLMMYKSLEEKSRFRMIHVNNEVKEILEVTGFDQFLL